MESVNKYSTAMVTTLMPETHYSRYLCVALQRKYQKKFKLYVYSNKEDKIEGLKELCIRQNWTQNLFYPLQIFKQAVKDRVSLIHLQHEFNMYGGLFTTLIFPLLLLALKLMRKKVIVTVHAVVSRKDIDLNFLETFSWPKKKFVVRLAKIVLFYIYAAIGWLSDVVLVHSNYLKSILVEDYKARPERIKIISHGVPERNAPPKVKKIEASWWDKTKNKKIILCFGYLVKRKGLEYLIEAFEPVSRKYQDYVLVLAGGVLNGHESYVQNLKMLVNKNQLGDKVIFTSFIDGKELEELFVRSQFVVLPCIYSISASGPLAQSASFYKPVIGTSLGAFREEISHNIDGLLCPPKDVISLERAMEKLIENPFLLKKMSENMQKKAKSRSWTNIAKETYSIYLNCLNMN